MTYLIDGHNLIPKVPGMSLTALDDEKQLITLLQAFCRRERKKVEVYFDNAPPGEAPTRTYGMVVAHFVRSGKTADTAIRQRLQRLGRTAPNWTVVSSDAAVLSSARAARARTLTSEAFVQLLKKAADDPRQEASGRENMGVDGDDLEDWLNLFGVDE